MATPPINIQLVSDLPPPVQTVSVLEMNDPKSPFLYDAVNSKKVDPPSIRDGEFMVENAATAQKLSSLREQLKSEVPGSTISVTHFSNWGTTVSSLLLYVKPQSRQEVCNIMAAANKLEIKVGMGGAYHSWSPTYPDSGGLLINTCDITLSDASHARWPDSHIKLNDAKTAVTIAPGVTTGQLMQFFLDNDVTFMSDVILPSVTYGGVLSGGCHGVGKTQTTMSDWVTSMTIVDGTGQKKIIPDDYVKLDGPSPKEILKAASASLGLFGVILDVTVTVEPMTNARVINSFDKTLSILKAENKADLIKLLQERDSLEVFWFPYNSLFDPMLKKKSKNTAEIAGLRPCELVQGKIVQDRRLFLWSPWDDELWCREVNFTSDQVTRDPGIPLYSKIMDLIAGGGMTLANAILGSLQYCLTPLTLSLAFKMLKFQYGTLQDEEVVKVPWAVHYRDAIDMNYAYDLEFAFPIDISNPTILNEAVKVVVDNTAQFTKDGSFFEDTKGSFSAFPLNLCMEFRVMKKSEALLCPASLGNEEHIIYIEVLSTVNTPGTHDYFEAIADGWKKLGGTPHWQKQWTFLDKNGSMVQYLKKQYGNNLAKFKELRNDLQVDPKDLFVNSIYSHFLS